MVRFLWAYSPSLRGSKLVTRKPSLQHVGPYAKPVVKADGHMQINTALEEEMKSIHALSIRQCWTPEQQKAKQTS